MDFNFEKLVEDIDALRQFQAEPVPETPSRTQAVRHFLVECYGPMWLFAGIVRFALPEGQTAHVALLPAPGVMRMRMVLEAPDGTLAPGQGVAQEQQEESEPEPEQKAPSTSEETPEQECLAGILPALMQIREVLEKTKMKKRRRRYLVGQLDHAVEHLIQHVVREK